MVRAVVKAWTWARLLVDIVSMKLVVWMLGRDGELLDSHLFFLIDTRTSLTIIG